MTPISLSILAFLSSICCLNDGILVLVIVRSMSSISAASLDDDGGDDGWDDENKPRA